METLETSDLETQLRRLYALGLHNLQEAETEKDLAFREGQLNALYSVALSYALKIE